MVVTVLLSNSDNTEIECRTKVSGYDIMYILWVVFAITKSSLFQASPQYISAVKISLLEHKSVWNLYSLVLYTYLMLLVWSAGLTLL